MNLQPQDPATLRQYILQRLAAFMATREARTRAHLIDRSDPAAAAAHVHLYSQENATRLVTHFFTRAFVHRFRCADPGCQQRATERCHSLAFPRPRLLQRAFQEVCETDDRPHLPMSLVEQRFVELHAEEAVGFRFLCHHCHAQERFMQAA